MSDNIKWEASNFQDKDTLYDLFEKAKYTLGKVERVDSEFVFGKDKSQLTENVESIYQLVNEEDDEFQILLIKSSKECRKKSWRKLIINIVKQWIAEYVILITEDFSEFWIEIIADEMDEELKFEPNNPSSKADKFVQDLLNRRPLFDPKGLTASQLQAKHELTASKLIKAIETNDEKKIRLLFQRAGLCSYADMDLICSREDAPLKKAIVEINFSKDDTEEWINKNLAKVLGDFRDKKKSDLNWIILIGKEGISYISENGIIYSSIEYPEKNEELVKLLTSLIANIDIRAAFNGETFESQFGPYSPFFSKSNYLMEIYLKKKENDLKVIREEWERYFGKVYKEGDVDEELFIKHSYLSLLIKNVLFCKYLPDKVVESAESFVELSDYFESKGVELFLNDFYSWANNIQEIREDIFQALNGAIYESDDIFRIIYQDMVSPATRHALGEFYTPPELAELMVDELYQFGNITLDPACGSGTFLVEIIKKIKNSGKSNDIILRSINNLYGFDVNPIAVLVSKANILLHLEEFSLEKLPINIYLTDSIKTIERKIQSNMVWGSFFTFPLGIYGNWQINEKFLQQPSKKDSYDYLKEFSKMLKFIDELMTKTDNLQEILKSYDNEFNHPWLNEFIPSRPKSYRDNIHFIIEQILELHTKKQNHIWLYLLYNSIGALLLRNRADLIIGNPPWVVLHSIYSNEYKNEIKKLAKDLDIMMGGKNASNTEISSIFCCRCKDLYLKENGMIFFVITAGIMSGDQHSKFRRFNGFGDIFMWIFDNDVFKIPSICIGMKNITQDIKSRIKIGVVKYKLKKNKDELLLEKQKPVIYVPYNYTDIKTDNDLVKRLIPLEKVSNLLPRGESYYYKKFYAGARLGPRILVFINILKKKDKIITFNPNFDIGSKKPWDLIPFKEAETELEYIFQATKSTELVPYAILKYYYVFLPIEHKNYEYNQSQIKPLAKNHFILLNQIYKKHQKKGASITDLWERLNYIGGLINPAQRGGIKVVYPGSGKFLKSALVRGNYIIDDKLYYYSTKDENEAYYLMGILNSNVISEDIKYRSATGFQGKGAHIHKRALDVLIPEFNQNEQLHKQIVEKSKFIEKMIRDKINLLKKESYNNLKLKYKCSFCKKNYSKKTFVRNREKHEKECKKVKKDHKWKLTDWIDLEKISIDQIELTQQKVQNFIFNDIELKNEFQEMNDLVIGLFES